MKARCHLLRNADRNGEQCSARHWFVICKAGAPENWNIQERHEIALKGSWFCLWQHNLSEERIECQANDYISLMRFWNFNLTIVFQICKSSGCFVSDSMMRG